MPAGSGLIPRRASTPLGAVGTDPPALRYLTAPLRPLPDLLILGAQKAGTRSLRSYLAKSERLAGPTQEVHYFDRQRMPSHLWYRAHFPVVSRSGATL